MNLGSLVGFVCGVCFLAISIVLAASFQVERVFGLVNLASIIIVIGGTISITLIANPFDKILNAMHAVAFIFKPKLSISNPYEAIENMLTLSNIARRKGIVALDESVRSLDDVFLQKGIMLVVDGTDAETIRSILENELEYIELRHKENQSVWELIGTQAPVWGMIGSIIGVIMMLQDISDPYRLGPSMAFALVALLYGSIMAHFIAIPIANKLKSISSAETLEKKMLIAGILAIHAGESSATISERLMSFLPANQRAKMKGGGNAY